MHPGSPAPAGPVISLTGDRVALGPLRRDLIPLYDRWVNDVEAAITYFQGDLRPDTREDTEARYQRLRADVTFTVYERDGMRPIGWTDLSQVDHFNRTAMLGVLIGEPECRGRGLGTEAVRLTLDWGFHGLGLHNIMLTVFSHNPRGISAFTRAGFREIGRRRQAKRVAGRAYDVVYMDCLASEFQGSVLKGLLPGPPPG